jgi:predicted NACHT family NTPase
MITTQQLNLWIAGGAVLLTFITMIVAFQTLRYMRGRDADVDIRTGWIEIHKAMINLRVQREFVKLARGAMGAHASGSPNQFEGRIRDVTLATAQLRAQLDRLNDDRLIVDLANFLDENKLTEKWQTDEYERAYDAFAQKVALNSRPK